MELAQKFHKRRSYSRQFRDLFHTQLEKYLHPILGFDIIAFDAYLHSIHYNFEDDGLSTKDFITREYGENAAQLILTLIEV